MEFSNITPFLDYYHKIRARTVRAIDSLPRENIDWRPRPGKFSFADIIRHIAATERYMFAENALLRPSRYPGCGPTLADGYDAVLAYFHARHAESLDIFGNLSPAQLQQSCLTVGGTAIPVWKWLRAMTEHEIHHRAQMYSYLSFLDLPSLPIFGLTEEEVRERSSRPAAL